MAENVLTNLTPDLYAALHQVSRELVGFIPAVAMDASLERAAIDQTIRSPLAPAASPAAITPGQLVPDTGNQTFTNRTITISNQYAAPIRWTGDAQRAMDSGPGYRLLLQNQIAEAIRAICNMVEEDLGNLYVHASNAVAPAGTNLFDANNFKDAANVRKCLVDNGAPMSDLQMVMSTAAGARLRGNNTVLNSVNSAGTGAFREQGILVPVHGLQLRESAQIDAHTTGSATSATTNTAGYAVGATSITLATAGSGTFSAGDVISFAGDDNKYVVKTGGAATGGTIVLQAPGLKVAIATAATAITVTSYTEANMAFARNAIQLVTRLPDVPAEGDMSIDSMVIVDQNSGLAFEVRAYPEYRRIHYEVSLAWGCAVMNPEHLCLFVD